MSNEEPGFSSAFENFVCSTGRWRDCDHEMLLERWRLFVDKCIAGYPSDADDYFNDLTVRDALEKAIANPALAKYPEMKQLQEVVVREDNRLRGLLLPDAFPKFDKTEWWVRGIVRKAGPRLVSEIRDRYNIVLEEA